MSVEGRNDKLGLQQRVLLRENFPFQDQRNMFEIIRASMMHDCSLGSIEHEVLNDCSPLWTNHCSICKHDMESSMHTKKKSIAVLPHQSVYSNIKYMICIHELVIMCLFAPVWNSLLISVWFIWIFALCNAQKGSINKVDSNPFPHCVETYQWETSHNLWRANAGAHAPAHRQDFWSSCAAVVLYRSKWTSSNWLPRFHGHSSDGFHVSDKYRSPGWEQSLRETREDACMWYIYICPFTVPSSKKKKRETMVERNFIFAFNTQLITQGLRHRQLPVSGRINCKILVHVNLSLNSGTFVTSWTFTKFNVNDSYCQLGFSRCCLCYS